MGVLLAAAAVAALVWAGVKALHVVPGSQAGIVERLGRYTRTLSPGLHLLVPFLDRVRTRVDLAEQAVELEPQHVLTRENESVGFDTVVHYRVTDPVTATYQVAHLPQALGQLTSVTLRNLVGGLPLEQALASRAEINTALQGVLADAGHGWGVDIRQVRLTVLGGPAVHSAAGPGARREAGAAPREAPVPRPRPEPRAEREPEPRADRPGERRTEKRAGGPAERPAEGQRAAPAGESGYQPHYRPLRPGDPRQVGPYTLVVRLDRGGTDDGRPQEGLGPVYLGQASGGRLAAVKIIRPELVADDASRRRFARGIEAACLVGDRHTAPVVDTDPEGDPPWLASAYVPGPSLADVLRHHGPLPVGSLHPLAAGVAVALEAIHACGIAHLDLRPGNILVSASGPRVVDFGLARALESAAAAVGREFLAPEQLTGGTVTPAADMYAFGLVLCRAAGAEPSAPGKPAETELDLLPARLHSVAVRCLDRDPRGRPTATDVLTELAPRGLRGGGPDDGAPGAWLPPAVRTMVERHGPPAAAG